MEVEEEEVVVAMEEELWSSCAAASSMVPASRQPWSRQVPVSLPSTTRQCPTIQVVSSLSKVGLVPKRCQHQMPKAERRVVYRHVNTCNSPFAVASSPWPIQALARHVHRMWGRAVKSGSPCHHNRRGKGRRNPERSSTDFGFYHVMIFRSD